MRVLKEYENVSLSYYDGQYHVLLEDVAIKPFYTYKEALNYFNALSALKPEGGYPSPLTEQFEIDKEDNTSTYDSSND